MCELFEAIGHLVRTLWLGIEAAIRVTLFPHGADHFAPGGVPRPWRDI
jgi:hypothetical protein